MSFSEPLLMAKTSFGYLTETVLALCASKGAQMVQQMIMETSSFATILMLNHSEGQAY